MERKQFTFYRSFFESIESMRTKKDKLDAYRMLCDYALNGNEPDLQNVSARVASSFALVRPVLDTAAKRSARLQAKLAEKVIPVEANDPFIN